MDNLSEIFKNISDKITTCSDTKSLRLILTEHYPSAVMAQLMDSLSGAKLVLAKSRQNTREKKTCIPKYLENVELQKLLILLAAKIPDILTMEFQSHKEEFAEAEIRQARREQEHLKKIEELTVELKKTKKTLKQCNDERKRLEKKCVQQGITQEDLEESLHSEKLVEDLLQHQEAARTDDLVWTDMDTAEDCVQFYELLNVHEWNDAKEELDNLEEGDVAEDLKLKMLFDIIMVSWDRMNSMADRLKNDADNQEAGEDSITKPELSKKLVHSLVKVCVERLSSHFHHKDGALLQLWKAAILQKKFKGYITEVTKLTWSMVWLTPQLTFRESDSYLGQQYLRLYENNIHPEDCANPDMIQVLPMMYENDTLRMKGTVLLSLPDKQMQRI